MNINVAINILSKYNIDLNRNKNAFIIKMANAIQILEDNGIEIIEPYFKKNNNSITTILYKCECGNIAESAVSNFANKKVYACKKCNAGKINSLTKRISLNDIKNNLSEKGFKVIKITNYNGNLEGSEWEMVCESNHSFKRSGNNIKNIKYCPFCFTDSCEENLIRDLIEIHFNAKFPSIRPDFLKSTYSNKNLELDMYNKDLKLAFEYNGIQHYEPIYGEKRLEISQRNDMEKNRLCEQNGVKLITIKHNDKKIVDKKEFLLNIINYLKAFDIYISSESLNKTMNKKQIFKNKGLEKIKSLLLKNNKRLISKNYFNLKSKVEVKCLICEEISKLSVSTIMNLETTPRKNCSKCKHLNKKNQSEMRHTSIAEKFCKDNNFSFIELQKNKEGHCSGFKYKNLLGEINLFGSKKYRKYIKENNLGYNNAR